MTLPANTPDIHIQNVIERDIDILLIQLLASYPEFQQWLIKQTSDLAEQPVKVTDVFHSYFQEHGESDIEIHYQICGKRHLLLIENKVDASFQPDQAKRYQLRSKSYIEKKLCEACKTVLIAPANYGDGKSVLHGFDSRISYEAISEWLSKNFDSVQIAIAATKLLQRATNKAKRYIPVADSAVTQLWHRYWELALEYAPELHMNEPAAEIGYGSDWVYFTNCLPPGFQIVHKMARGEIDLMLPEAAENVEQLEKEISQLMQPYMLLTAVGKSAAIRVRVPVVRRNKSFGKQKRNVMECLDQAKALLSWFRAVQERW